jgi:hypothetical protein
MVKKQEWETAGDRDENWAKRIERFRDPVTGKVVPQNPQGEASPDGTGLNKPSDSKA